MRRREFVAGLAGAAAWPIAARAQQMRRIGVMVALSESDPELRKRLAAFRQALDRLGWSEGRNVHLDYRFAPAGTRAQEFAKELLMLQPDVILAFSTPVTATFQRGDPHKSYRVPWRCRCRHARFRPKLGKSRGQSYGPNDVRRERERQVLVHAQGDRTAGYTRCFRS